MSKISCEIIQDLLPSYIDELTSDITNIEIEAHIKECEQCRMVLENMKSPEAEAIQEEIEEIDFLKKTKKNHQKNILICIAVVCAIAVAILGVRNYFSGQYINTDYLAYNLDVSENELKVAVNTTSNQGIQSININESEGIVELSVRCVPKSLFYKTSKEANYIASEKVRQVWIGNRIIWANGELISPLTSSLYNAYNPYVGDMSSNGKIAGILNMTSYTGGFINELQTSKEPYSWKMAFENEFSSNVQEQFEENLKKYAYIYLSQIGNLSEVVYEYKMDGEKKIFSVTSEEASEFAGVDIKKVGEDVNLLEELVRKTELSNVVLGGASVNQ